MCQLYVAKAQVAIAPFTIQIDNIISSASIASQTDKANSVDHMNLAAMAEGRGNGPQWYLPGRCSTASRKYRHLPTEICWDYIMSRPIPVKY